MNWLESMGIILLGLAGFLLLFGVGEVLRTGAFVLAAERTVGEVSEYRVVDQGIPFTDPEAGRRYYPYVVFSVDGVEHTFTADRGTATPRYQIGEEVAVAYNPERVDDARIGTIPGIWGRALVLFLTSGLFVLSGGLPYYRMRRARRVVNAESR